MRLFRPWTLMRMLYPSALFRLEGREKKACLTFDDGPDPVSTPAILEILDRYGVKAVFFCSGEAAERHPGLVDIIRSAGHLTGNHGYRHLDGWKTGLKEYAGNAHAAASLTSDRYFRPPYGHLTIKQYRVLSKTYKLIFWDLMAWDFDPSFGAKRSLKVLKRKIRPGSVIVLHDSPKASAPVILAGFLEEALSEGYTFVLP